MLARPAGAVIAGGRSLRMGRDKALMRLGGVRLIELVADRLARSTCRVAVIADRADRYPFLTVPVHADIHPDCGPLGGIHTALRLLDEPEVFVLPCDTPFVSQALIEYIAAFPTSAPARIATMDGTLHPLCGVYTRRLLPAIEQALADGRLALRDLLERTGARTIPVTPDLPFYDPRLLLNLNDPAALGLLDPDDR